MHCNLRDDADVGARLRSAGAAFASLRKPFFASRLVPLQQKKLAYEGLVLNILLYGSETWALRDDLRRRLRSFHNGCVRAMCRVSRWHTWQFGISQASLEARLGVLPIDSYVTRRKLRWAGHVMRMDFDARLPRVGS